MSEHTVSDESNTQPLQMLTFTLGGLQTRRATFGVDVALIREVAKAPHITPIAGSAPHISGMVSLRGDLMRVVDLSSAIQDRPHRDKDGFLIVTDIHDSQQAFLVSGIESILRVNRHEIRQIEKFSTLASGLIAGVVMTAEEKLITLLHLEALQLEQDAEQMAALAAHLAKASERPLSADTTDRLAA